MQDRIWNNLANIKFKALYTAHVSRSAYNAGNAYSFFLAFASASSVSAWAIWDKYPIVWASIVAISQILHIAKPYVPFIKGDKELMEMSLQYEFLYLIYERLWFDYRKDDCDKEGIEELFYSYREKEHDINTRFKHIVCPEIKSLVSKADAETNKFLEANFK